MTASLLLTAPAFANAQPAADKEPAPALILPTDFCTLPLCRDAEAMRRTGDLAGALKLYRYIQEEVDVDEKVLRKPLLYYAIAVLHLELKQPQLGQDALAKYQLYMASHPDSELPQGQRREDVERLEKELRNVMGRLRIASKSPGLRVLVDDKEVGVTPLVDAVPVPPGLHRVQIAGAGGEAQEVDVASGQEVVLWPLATARPPAAGAVPAGVVPAEPAKPIGKEGRPAWRIAVGALGIAGGITMIGFGAASLAADGRCASGAPAGPCPIEVGSDGRPITRVIDGRAMGGGLIAGGIILSAVSTILIAVPAKRRPVTAAVSFVNGASLSLATSF